MEVVKFKDVGSALGSPGSDLRGMYFREPLTLEKFPERPGNPLFYLEPGPFPDIPERKGPHIQPGLQRGSHLPFGNRDRHRFRRFREDLHAL